MVRRADYVNSGSPIQAQSSYAQAEQAAHIVIIINVVVPNQLKNRNPLVSAQLRQVIINRAHSFLRVAEFQAELRNLPFSMEF